MIQRRPCLIHEIDYHEDVEEGIFYDTTTNYYQKRTYKMNDVRIRSSKPYNITKKTRPTSLSWRGICYGIATLVSVGLTIGLSED